MTALPPDPWVVVARIGKPFGLDGSVRVWPEADLAVVFHEEVPLAAFMAREVKILPLHLSAAREDAHGWVVKWEGYDTRESTISLRNALVVVRREDLPEPPEGEVYWADLMGARVRTREGRNLGVVVDLLESAANSVVEVENENGGRFLLPLTVEVDAALEYSSGEGEKAVLLVNLLEGLEEATEVN